MSLRGYGLWLDTYGEATFDLNVTDRYHVRVRLFTTRACAWCSSKGRSSL